MTVADHNWEARRSQARTKIAVIFTLILHRAFGNYFGGVTRPADFNDFYYGFHQPTQNKYTLDIDQTTQVEIGAPTTFAYFDMFVEGTSVYSCTGSTCPVT